ncbi:50S ribosomal protein L22 [Candidatus Parcubacteria bacterium]|nr:50S ribosomal protein L22 [Candidatus Parcubacteria bacterium]
MATAQLSNLRHSPRKVRLVADLVRGKTVQHALTVLKTVSKSAGRPLQKLIESALAGARQTGTGTAETLIVSEIRVDEGQKIYRYRPASRGRASPIRKRASHVLVTLAEKTPTVKKEAVAKK